MGMEPVKNGKEKAIRVEKEWLELVNVQTKKPLLSKKNMVASISEGRG